MYLQLNFFTIDFFVKCLFRMVTKEICHYNVKLPKRFTSNIFI